MACTRLMQFLIEKQRHVVGKHIYFQCKKNLDLKINNMMVIIKIMETRRQKLDYYWITKILLKHILNREQNHIIDAPVCKKQLACINLFHHYLYSLVIPIK